MARTPVALDKSPSAGYVDRIPRVPKAVSLELDARLISGRFAVTLDDDTVKASITVHVIESDWAISDVFGGSKGVNLISLVVSQSTELAIKTV